MNDFTTGAPTDRLPTLVRTRSGYRVFDPALIGDTRYVIDDAGDLVYTRLPAGALTGTAVVVAALTAVAAGGDVWGRSLLIFLVALAVTFTAVVGVLSLIHTVTDPVRAYRRRFGHTRFAVDVTDRSGAAWQLCARAERLAATRSWQSGRIDPTRTLGGLLWTAVGRGEDWAAESVLALAEPATGPDLTSV